MKTSLVFCHTPASLSLFHCLCLQVSHGNGNSSRPWGSRTNTRKGEPPANSSEGTSLYCEGFLLATNQQLETGVEFDQEFFFCFWVFSPAEIVKTMSCAELNIQLSSSGRLPSCLTCFFSIQLRSSNLQQMTSDGTLQRKKKIHTLSFPKLQLFFCSLQKSWNLFNRMEKNPAFSK